MQALFNSDESLKDQNAQVDVTFDCTELKLVSGTFGYTSKIEFAEVSANFETNSWLSTSLFGATGVIAQCAIEGFVAFGSGNVLLKGLDADACGLKINVKEHTPPGGYTMSFSRGLTGDLNNFISTMLGGEGVISRKEELIGDQRSELIVDQDE